MTEPGMRSHDDWLPDPPTDRVKVRAEQMLAEISLLQRMTPKEAGMVWNGDAVKRAIEYLTESYNWGMESAAQIAPGTLCGCADAIRKKIKQ